MEFTEFYHRLGVIPYRRMISLFCRNCGYIIGHLYGKPKEHRSSWSPYVCRCENYTFFAGVTFSEVKKIERELLYGSQKPGKYHLLTETTEERSAGAFRLSQGVGSLYPANNEK